MGLEFTSHVENGWYRTQNEVPDAIMVSDFNTYKSGLYSRYVSASGEKNRLEHLPDRTADSASVSWEIKEMELSVIVGILKNQYVARKVAEEISVYSNRMFIKPQPISFEDDKTYVSFLKNAAAQAALIHYLAFTKKFGAGVVVPSAEVKRTTKQDIILSENPGEERPILCRSWTGDDIIFYVEKGEPTPEFILEDKLGTKYTGYPLNNKKPFDDCKVATEKSPVLIAIPYKRIATFMNRNWDVSS